MSESSLGNLFSKPDKIPSVFLATPSDTELNSASLPEQNDHLEERTTDVHVQLQSSAPVQHIFVTPKYAASGRLRPISASIRPNPRPMSASSTTKVTATFVEEPIKPIAENDEINTSGKIRPEHEVIIPVKKNNYRRNVFVVSGVVIAAILISVAIAIAAVLTKSSELATPPTTPEIIIEFKDDYSLKNAGVWGDWSGYSSCPVTCGSGYITRTRTCLNKTCSGTSSQAQPCGSRRCPLNVYYGVWTTWAKWSSCSKSCNTGTQQRTRSCNKENSQYENCIGTNEQVRNCNGFTCPDCSRTCSNGVLSSDCTYCSCGITYYGKVMSSDGVTLGSVTVSPSNAPYKILATTTVDGLFSLSDHCSHSLFSLQKNSYISRTIGTTSLKQSANSLHVIILNKTDPLTVIKHPKDKMRIVGDSVTLCCEITGNPLPDNYEWLKDSNLISTTTGGAASKLELNNLKEDDSGYYQCRGNNDYGSIISSNGYLIVKDSADNFCSSVPQSNIITLPDGCTFKGKKEFDQGNCPASSCRGQPQSNNNCHSEEIAYCCAPTTFSRVDLACEGNFTLPIMMATACGCRKCAKPELSLSGIAYGTDGSPLEEGDIISNGTILTKTSLNGTFNFAISMDTERMTLLFRDITNEALMDTIYVLNIPKGSNGMQYITVKMYTKGIQTTLSSSNQSVLALQAENASSTIGSVKIPPNAFYTENGDKYTGKVVASIAVVDPNDISSIDSAPGDFSTVNEEGSEEQLESYGMFSFEFKDENGNRLNVPDDITVEVPSQLAGNKNIKLWSLNTVTGRWQLASSNITSRRKRQANGNVAGVSYTQTWYNFDSISNHACYSKVRVFETRDFVKQISGARVSVIIQDGNSKSLSQYRAYTDQHDRNGYCIIHPCDSYRDGSVHYNYNGYVFAEHSGKQLIPVDVSDQSNGLSNMVNILGVTTDSSKYTVQKMDLGLSNNGPLYDWGGVGGKGWRYSDACSHADMNENHFRFSADICYKAYDVVEYYSEPDTTCYEPYNLLWNSLPSVIQLTDYTVTYIKVYTPGLWDLKFRATSSVFNKRTTVNFGNVGDIFGYREDCIDGFSEVVCLEVKAPTQIGCSNDKTVQETKLTISLEVLGQERYNFSEVNENLYTKHDVVQGEGNEVFKMHLGIDGHGPAFGLYTVKHPVLGIAKQKAKSMCLAGSSDEKKMGSISKEGWAVKVNGSCSSGQLDLVFAFLGHSYFYYHYYYSGHYWWINAVTNYIKTLIEKLDISESRVRFAFVGNYSNNSGYDGWDLSSNIATSPELIMPEINSTWSDSWYYNYYYYYYYYGCSCDSDWLKRQYPFDHIQNDIFNQPGDRKGARNVVIGIYDPGWYGWCCHNPTNTVAVSQAQKLKTDARIIIAGSHYTRTRTSRYKHAAQFASSDAELVDFEQIHQTLNLLRNYTCA